MPYLPFSADDVGNSLDGTFVSRGRTYRDEGRVLELRVDEAGTRMVAAVVGARTTPYSVSVHAAPENGGWRISGSCSCPVSYNCKHVAATALEALRRFPHVRAPRGGDRDAVVQTPVPHLLLRSRRVPLDDGRQAIVDTVALGFAYDDTRPHLRHHGFEHRARERIVQSGFLPLTSRGRARETEFWLAPGEGTTGWARFLDRVVPELEAEGWHVDTDTTFRHRVVYADDAWDAEIVDDGNRWFELDLGIDVGGKRVSLLPIIVEALRLGVGAEDGAPLYAPLPDGGFVALPAQRLRALLDTLIELFDENPLANGTRLTLTAAHVAHLDELQHALRLRWLGGERLRNLAEALRTPPAEIPPPETLTATLRPYQQTGVNWLQHLRMHGLGAILADDMGLGKTVQTLAHLLVEKHEGRLRNPCLIVAPTSVLPNWRSECARFAPGLRVVTLHGPQRAASLREIEGADIVLTSYALLLRDADALLPLTWELAVLDEAQAIKNPLAKVTRVAWQLRASQRIALTGTPIENHLDELWSIAAFAIPGLLGERKRFARLFRTPIEKRGDSARSELLAARMRPFMLRRTKERVESQLPEKTEILQRVEIGGEQRDLYETVRLAMHARVRTAIGARGLARSRIVVLDALLKLRQVCCDPRLVKLAAARDVERSAKLELLLEMLPELIEDGRRILLFSQFTSMLDLIVPELRARDIPFVELRGDTVDRATPVARFQSGEIPLFLISLKAGGTGLNLTAADTVIHYDPWWNPAVERQATDRAHRIGQTQHVFVYKLVTVGTVEERILEMHARKSALAESLFEQPHASEAPTAEELEALLAPL